jgi:hypothetical protein
MQHLGEFYIINKRRPTREKATVLSPGDWCTDICLDHIFLPYWPAESPVTPGSIAHSGHALEQSVHHDAHAASHHQRPSWDAAAEEFGRQALGLL